MNDNILIEVSDILESFDIKEITKLIKDQINIDLNYDNYTDIMVDHLKPLYYKYAEIVKNDTLDEDIKNEAEYRFHEICKAFLNQIFTKFDLALDDEWVENHQVDIPAITIAFYSFFILDFKNNLNEVIMNYILQNGEMIYKTFEDMKNKKDASTLTNKKILSNEMALIASNIYNISEWVISQLEEEDFLSYIDSGYIPLKLIKTLYEEGILSGEFMVPVNEIFKKSISLKSIICFNIIYNIKEGAIKDIFNKGNEK